MTLRTIGLLGGMSYHSTVDYYMGINDAIASAMGGHTSAPLLVDSLNFQQVRDMQVAEDWEGAGRLLAHHARLLQGAGAEAVMICTNLMHKVAPMVEEAIDVPLLHIVDAVAEEAHRRGLSSLGIMGAGWTMRDPFYAGLLADKGIEPVIAMGEDIELTDAIVFEELTQGIILDYSRDRLLGVVDRLSQAGAEGIVLACTELPLILTQECTPIPLINSTHAHVRAAIRFVLGDEPAHAPAMD